MDFGVLQHNNYNICRFQESAS